MSPNVGNFVHDLVEMAKAMETLPQVQAELKQAHADIEAYATSVQRLETKLMDRANELTELQSRIRSLEVERDDAQFHALEADDRTSRALDFIKATFGNAGSLIQALEPARPVESQPEATTTLETSPTGAEVYVTKPTSAAPWPSSGSSEDHSPIAPQGQSEPLPSPTASSTADVSQATAEQPVTHSENVDTASPAPEVAPAHPTATETDGLSATAPTPNAETRPDASTTNSNEPGRFEGKLYSQVVKSGNYPTRQEWEANGGTIDNWYA